MKKISNIIFSKIPIILLLILIQLGLLLSAILYFTNNFVYFYLFSIILSIVALFSVLNSDYNPSYKLAWVIPIMLFPIFGGLFYLLFGGKKTSKKIHNNLNNAIQNIQLLLPKNKIILNEIKSNDPSVYRQAKYINDSSLFPVYKNTTTKYLPIGETMFEHMKEELRKAKKYIFMEYFIIEEGKMWGELFEILKEKASQGLDVRVMYDAAGCLLTLPPNFPEKLKKAGIKVVVFNPFKPFLSIIMNNRDHRKITVIDGVTSFTGGINLADEYINETKRYGHWKDTGIMLKGDASWSFTVMFLQSWNFILDINEDINKYLPKLNSNVDLKELSSQDGFVQPFGDSPLDDDIVGETVYINMINKAKDYIYITTPYLIIDNELMTALVSAAKSGVDVKIITPAVSDSKIVHLTTRSYYLPLISAGVNIYEYTPGFIHCKTFVSDDEVAVVGTINLDFRSLYLHFECGTWLYKCNAVTEMKDDYFKILEHCKKYTIDDYNRKPALEKYLSKIIRVFTPLM
ncbi:MAG: cardiolipin synthase [Clostridium sp.]|uniref:cardiolipin synthase n=1 Tax=Clostridium sp. TaxID=1506 RepID=UPI003070E3C7